MFGQEKFENINKILNRRFTEKKALVAVHRGAWGGNIVENTIPSFDLSIDMGGDIFECDISSSTDGILYVFHDGTEPLLLGCSENIKTMSSQEIEQFEYLNSIGKLSGAKVEPYEKVAAYFTGEVLYNIDRAWDCLPQLAEVLRKYPHTLNQAIIKTPVTEEYLDFFNNCREKYMYMPIVYNMEEVDKVLSYTNVNTVGMELITGSNDGELFLQKNINYIKSHNLFVWANVITLAGHGQHRLFGELDDDMALLVSKDRSWGEALRKGIDVLQTDWPLQLCRFRDTYFK